jgi:hypothetical protein
MGFTMFGEPDVQIDRTDEGVVARLRGVDVYDPTTGVIRSIDTGEIALWMIDTDCAGVVRCRQPVGPRPARTADAAGPLLRASRGWPMLCVPVRVQQPS